MPPVETTAPFWDLFDRTILHNLRIYCKNRSRQNRKFGRGMASCERPEHPAPMIQSTTHGLRTPPTAIGG